MSATADNAHQKLEQFKALARGLLKVPKAEVDAAEAARKKRKPRTKPA